MYATVTRNNYILLRSGLSSGCGCTPACMSYVLTVRLKLVHTSRFIFGKAVVESHNAYHSYPVQMKIYSLMLQIDVCVFSLVMVVSIRSLCSYKNCQRRSYVLQSCFHNYNNNTSWLISSACGLLTHSHPDSCD
jgi:hypothetical protein